MSMLPQNVLAARQQLEAIFYSMASNTQHVEGGVHSAKVVAGPGRFEPLRSALEIIRSMWNCYDQNKMKSGPTKSLSFINELEEQFKKLEKQKQDLGVDTFNAMVEDIVVLCHAKHYKSVRHDEKKEKHIENLSGNRVEQNDQGS